MKYKGLICIILIVFGQFSASAQIAATPLDEQLKQGVKASCADSSGNLYVLQITNGIGFREGDLQIRKWNGLFWVSLPTLQVHDFVHSDMNRIQMIFFENQLHLAGSFKSENGINGIAKFNGNSWVALGKGINSDYAIHDEISVNHIIGHKGSLYIAGDFTLADSQPVKHFVSYENGIWSGINVGDGQISGVESIGDTLFVGGSFDNINGLPISHLAKFVNGIWSEESHNFSEKIVGLSNNDGELIVLTEKGFYHKIGGVWKLISNDQTILPIQLTSSATMSNGTYLTGVFKDISGSSVRMLKISNDTIKPLLYQNSLLFGVDSSIYVESINNELIYVLGDFNRFQNRRIKHIAAFKPGFSVSFGSVYRDNNNNCLFDTGDEPIANTLISFNNGAYYTTTDSVGYYQIFAQTNTESNLKIFPSQKMESSCSGDEFNIPMATNDDYVWHNFAVTLKQSIPLKVDLWSNSGFKVKHGFYGDYTISLVDVEPKQLPVTVTLKHDERLEDFSCSENYRCSKNGQIVWVLKEVKDINISFRIDPSSISMGEMIHFKCEVAGVQNESSVSTSLNQEVVSAFDPNDKQCDAEEIELGTPDLSYHIRFQNLGTAEATDVHLVDTIDNLVPLEYIQILNNSHFSEYATSYKVRDHSIIWSFNGINLPPKSQSNDEMSSGFVSYRNGLPNQLKVGQQISNKAYIYFDFQPPVITNTTVTTVIEPITEPAPQQESLWLYPNPVTSQVTLESPVNPIIGATIYSTDGKLVETFATDAPNLRISIPVQNLPTGFYFIKVQYYIGFETLPFVIN